jgi:uncharacterized membrane protein YqgA involved in biofilm formation
MMANPMGILLRLVGTLINAALALLGSTLGLLGRGVAARYREVAFVGLGLAVLAIGADMALDHPNPLVVTAGMVLGGLAGRTLRLEEGLAFLGRLLEQSLAFGGGRFVEGFTLATVVWCVGPLSLLGAIQSGLDGQNALLITKGVLDGTSGLFFAQALGPGVAAATLSILVYEGSIALLAGVLAPHLTSGAIAAMSNVGGLMVMAIGVNLLLPELGQERRLPAAVFLPALVLAPLLAALLSPISRHL